MRDQCVGMRLVFLLVLRIAREKREGLVLYNLVCQFWQLVTGNKVALHTVL